MGEEIRYSIQTMAARKPCEDPEVTSAHAGEDTADHWRVLVTNGTAMACMAGKGWMADLRPYRS